MINGNIGGTADNDVGNITIGATGHNGNITLSGDIGTASVAGAAVEEQNITHLEHRPIQLMITT